jgi:hypothetical protein
MEEYGHPRLFWKQEIAGSNPAIPTGVVKGVEGSIPAGEDGGFGSNPD